MPFDPTEFATQSEDDVFESQEQGVPTVDEFVDGLTTPQPQVAEEVPEDDEAYMNNVRERHEVSSHYIQLLEAPLFGNQTAPARIVEREVRKYVRERLEVLLGIRQDRPQVVQQEPLFSDEETASIKLLLASMRAKGMLAAAAPPPVAPAPPQAVRAASPPPARPAPQVVVRTAPAPIQRTPAVVPTPAVVAAPPAPAVQKPAAPAAQPKKRGPKATTKTVVRAYDGKEVEVHRIQRPSGAVPFPSSDMEMTAATEMAASIQAANSNLGTGAGLDISGLAAMALNR